jgi:hypothetical protein
MPDMQNERKTPKTDGLDEIDRFISSLPSDDTSDDSYNKRPHPHTEDSKLSLTGAMILLGWFCFLVAVLTALRALPLRDMYIYDRAHHGYWNPAHLIPATWFLMGTFAISTAGLAICLIRKYKITGGTALNFLISGVLSAVLGIIFLNIT